VAVPLSVANRTGSLPGRIGCICRRTGRRIRFHSGTVRGTYLDGDTFAHPPRLARNDPTGNRPSGSNHYLMLSMFYASELRAIG
jgi:hypothetical protein